MIPGFICIGRRGMIATARRLGDLSGVVTYGPMVESAHENGSDV